MMLPFGSQRCALSVCVGSRVFSSLSGPGTKGLIERWDDKNLAIQYPY